MLGGEHDAEDAFQATFLVLAQRARAIRQGGNVAGWLHAVAHRIAGCCAQRSARWCSTRIRCGAGSRTWAPRTSTAAIAPPGSWPSWAGSPSRSCGRRWRRRIPRRPGGGWRRCSRRSRRSRPPGK
ncbi:MAG TPA: hypothetical protein VIL46_00350, partial [Gemmataceae bacterium]